MDGCFGRWVVFGWINESLCRYVGGGFVDTWMDVSVGGWLLGGCMIECVGSWVVFEWMYERMCR